MSKTTHVTRCLSSLTALMNRGNHVDNLDRPAYLTSPNQAMFKKWQFLRAVLETKERSTEKI